MQAGAQILMEQKNRGGTVLCAASQCFHTLLKLPLPGQFVFSFSSFSLPICSFLPSAAGTGWTVTLTGDWQSFGGGGGG